MHNAQSAGLIYTYTHAYRICTCHGPHLQPDPNVSIVTILEWPGARTMIKVANMRVAIRRVAWSQDHD